MGNEIIIKIDGIDVDKRKELEPGDDREYISPYARFFDRENPKMDLHSDPEYMLMFLRQQEVYVNELLKVRGHVFLNEVYDMLGIPRTKAGQVVGWIYDSDNPVGDNHIDFDIYSKRNIDFVNGFAYSALLDFNVDGIILDKIYKD